MNNLNDVLLEVNNQWETTFWKLDKPIREGIISKYTDAYKTIGVDVGLVPKILQETGNEDPEDTDFVIAINLICERYEDSKPIKWTKLSIKESMFEEIADSVAMQFEQWAEDGSEDGNLNFPNTIRRAFIDADDENCSYYGAIVCWNDKTVY
jgi:hypothetical protein